MSRIYLKKKILRESAFQISGQDFRRGMKIGVLATIFETVKVIFNCFAALWLSWSTLSITWATLKIVPGVVNVYPLMHQRE